MVNAVQYFLLGTSFMFTAMIAWIFWRKGSDMLSRLVTVLMTVMAAGFVKDAVVLAHPQFMSALDLITAVDVVAVPLYACILWELCNPGRLTLKTIALVEAPFVILPLLMVLFKHPVFYHIDMILAVILGLSTATWACFAIPRYNRSLKATFSYNEDIDLRWLQNILWAFFIILTVWVISCTTYSPWYDAIYMTLTLMLWIFICYFIYKHKSVVDELHPVAPIESIPDKSPDIRSQVFARITRLIVEDRIYLNPMLRLSDIARMANTNRTYASAYFKTETGMTFYDHINRLRVKHAMGLLTGTPRRLDEIAEESGFNSRQSFHRVFVAIAGMTPAQYRASTPPITYW